MHKQWIYMLILSLTQASVQAMDRAPSNSRLRFKRTNSGNFICTNDSGSSSPCVSSAVNQVDDDFAPPDIFRIAPDQSFSSSASSSYADSDSSWYSSGNNDDENLVWPDLLHQHEDRQESESSIVSTCFLMLHDEQTDKSVYLEADTKKELLQRYLIHYITHAGTRIASLMHEFIVQKSAKLTFYPQGNLIGIRCMADKGFCAQMYSGVLPSDLTLQLFAHHAIEHSQQEYWKHIILSYMSSSQQEALDKYNASMQTRMQKAMDDDVLLYDDEKKCAQKNLAKSRENVGALDAQVLLSSSSLTNLLTFDDRPLPQLGSWAEDLWNASNQLELFMVAYDPQAHVHVVFTGHTKNLVLSRYLKYLVMHKSDKYASPKQFTDNGKKYTCLCSVENCNYTVHYDSRVEAQQEMLVHTMLHHSKDVALLRFLYERIKDNLDDALLAFKEI